MASSQQKPIRLDELKNVASRRLREGWHILDLNNHKFFDGAVTYALLSVECSFKALILFDNGVNTQNELPEDVKKAFQGKRGHNLTYLYGLLSSQITQFFGTPEADAVTKLANRAPDGPYDFRYGTKKPLRQQAKPAIEEAAVLIDCMKRIVS